MSSNAALLPMPPHPMTETGEVTFTVFSFSRGGRWWSTLGGPVVRLVQRRFVRRYLAVVAQAAA